MSFMKNILQTNSNNKQNIRRKQNVQSKYDEKQKHNRCYEQTILSTQISTSNETRKKRLIQFMFLAI